MSLWEPATRPPLLPEDLEPGRAYELDLGRDWERVCEGFEARYAELRGAGEHARVVFCFRVAEVNADA